MRKSLALLVMLSLFSCERFDERTPFEEFRIKKGKHSSRHRLIELEHEFLSYDVIFDETAVYQTTDERHQADVNKLFGFSECNSLHEENSSRFGWRWYNDQLEIFGFLHLDGDIVVSPVGVVELNKAYRYNLYLMDDHYEFEIEGITDTPVKMDRSHLVCNKGVYYRLWPYFGGDETAPHDISIFMRLRYDEP